MKITIITVVYNGETSIKKTLESVLGQSILEEHTQEKDGNDGTKDVARDVTQDVALEYLIIDGASTDATVAIAREYEEAFREKGVSYRIQSEPDGGIYDAMNKGVRLSEGNVIGILNSGDWYEPQTLDRVVKTFCDTGCDLMFANIRIHKADGSTVIKKASLKGLETSRHWNHPTTFVQARLYRQYPFRNLGIHDDYGFYLQVKSQGAHIVIVDEVLANFCMGGASNRKSFKDACRRVRDRYLYCYRINGYSRFYIIECVIMEAGKMILG